MRLRGAVGSVGGLLLADRLTLVAVQRAGQFVEVVYEVARPSDEEPRP